MGNNPATFQKIAQNNSQHLINVWEGFLAPPFQQVYERWKKWKIETLFI